LGVCVVDIRSGAILDARTMDLGEEPLRWRVRLFPQLDDLHQRFALRGVASESPVILYGARKKNSGPACAACGHARDSERDFVNQKSMVGIFGSALLVETWAAANGLPFQHVRPMAIKEFACVRSGEPFQYGKPPTKAAMVRMVETVSGSALASHHAADAYFAALTLYSVCAA